MLGCLGFRDEVLMEGNEVDVPSQGGSWDGMKMY